MIIDSIFQNVGEKMYRFHVLCVTVVFLTTLWMIPMSTEAKIGDQQVITVKKGDTLYRLARKYQSDVNTMVTINRLQDPSMIRIGQKLRVPSTKKNVVSTQKIMKPNVKTLSRGKYLGQFTLTAYTAGPESTGKQKSHPAYGITASGEPAIDGLTIAVDPDVIPIGSRVYIEGVGYRIAQDVGSAIQGKRIDIFINDLSKAKQFGVKKDVRVELVE